MENTHAIATWTDYSATTVYTAFATENISSQTADNGWCTFTNTITNTTQRTRWGEFFLDDTYCGAFCDPAQWFCLNGTYYPVSTCYCLPTEVLVYSTLVETCLSLIGCIVALLIYCVFGRNLIRAERDASRTHWVHFNLIVSFILRDIMTITSISSEIQNLCWHGLPFFITIFIYFVMGNFFWMFVEGLYLYVSVTQPYWQIDSKPWLCTKMALFAWGCPGLLATAWTIWGMQSISRNPNYAGSQASSGALTCTIEQLNAFNTEKLPAFICVHMWIFMLLMFNLLMLIKILLILRKKLTSVQGSAEQDSKNRRMAKATLFLVVLLGVPNIFPFLFNRVEDQLGAEFIFIINFAFVNMNSIQGLMVAILYVLCNTEVRNEVKRQFHRRMSHHSGCFMFRRDDRRRRFGSMAHDTTRRTECPTVNNTSCPNRVEIYSSNIVSEDRTLQQNVKLLANGGNKSNGSRHNSNESHSMTTIDETEQDCLLKGPDETPQLSVPPKPDTVDGAYKRLNDNPETTL